MANSQLEQLTKKAEQLNINKKNKLTKVEKKLYYKYRNEILDKNKIDNNISQAIANRKSDTWVFKEKLINNINIAKLIEIPYGKYEKSILDELRDLYPSPIKCYGKIKALDWTKQHGTYYYAEYYIIKIKWNTSRSCSLI